MNAAAWLSLLISHSLWSAIVLLRAAIAMAPTIASHPMHDRAADAPRREAVEVDS